LKVCTIQNPLLSKRSSGDPLFSFQGAVAMSALSNHKNAAELNVQRQKPYRLPLGLEINF